MTWQGRDSLVVGEVDVRGFDGTKRRRHRVLRIPLPGGHHQWASGDAGVLHGPLSGPELVLGLLVTLVLTEFDGPSVHHAPDVDFGR